MPTYQLRSAYVGNYGGGTIFVDNSRSLDVGAALTSGGGTIVVAPTDAALIRALDNYAPLMRTGAPDPPAPVYQRNRTLTVTEDVPTVAGAVPVLQPDGTYYATALGAAGGSLVKVSTDNPPSSLPAGSIWFKVDGTSGALLGIWAVSGPSVTVSPSSPPADLPAGSVYFQTNEDGTTVTSMWAVPS